MAEGIIRDAIRKLIEHLDGRKEPAGADASDPGADDVYMGPDPRVPPPPRPSETAGITEPRTGTEESR